MNTHLNKLAAIVIAVALFGPTFKIAEASGDRIADSIRQKLADMVPGIGPVEVRESPTPNVYLVSLNGQQKHVYLDGDMLLLGDLINSATRENLTAKAKFDWVKTQVAALDTDSLVSFGPTSPVRSVYVFTDVDCGYCRKFHQSDVEKLNDANITVHYLGYPRTGLNTVNHQKLESVWCAKDPKSAMNNAKNGLQVTSEACTNRVAEHFALGQSIGVQGTPAMVLDDGTFLPGYRNADQLLAILKPQVN